MLQEGTICTCRTSGRALPRGMGCANRIMWRKSFAHSARPRGKSHTYHLHCAFLHNAHQDTIQDQARGQQGPLGWRRSPQEDCDFGPARSSQPYLLSELLPNVSMGFKSHMAHISFFKAVVDLWIWYLRPLRLWRCYSWHLYTEAVIKNHFQSGFVVGLPHKHMHTHRVSSTLNPPPPLDDTTLRDWKPWLPEERKGLSAASCQVGRQQHEGWVKQWDPTSMKKRLPSELFALSVAALCYCW